MDKRYRVAPQDLDQKRDLTDRIYAEMPARAPEHPTCYEGEWVCEHEPCPVRAVRLHVKALFHQHLPRLRCPLCLRTLVFRHWLNVIVLQEISAAATNPHPSPPATKRGIRARKRKTSS